MIKCICINDKNQLIPSHRQVKKGNEYHITHIYKMKNMGNILGCDIYEAPMGEDCLPYEHFRLDRFAFTEEALKDLIQLAYDCGELNDFDMNKVREFAKEQLEEA